MSNTSVAILKVLRGANAGECLEISGPEVILGRHRTCHVVLPLDTVSRQHARLFVRDGHFHAEDLESLNGTFINDLSITVPTRLEDGDIIRINKVVFEFRAAGAAERNTTHLEPRQEEEEDDSTTPPPIIARLNVWDSAKRASVSSEAKLRAMLEMTRCLDHSLSIEEVLQKILDGLSRVFPQADRLYVLMADRPNGRLALKAMRRSAKADEDKTLLHGVSRTIAKSVMDDGQAVLSADALRDQRFETSQSVHEFEVRSMMCAALVGPSNKPTGVIHVDSRDAARQFAQDDLDVLAAAATLAGQVVEHIRLNDLYLQSERLSAIGQMMTGLAHESRNALQRSQACLERLSMRVQDRPDALDLIERIQMAQDQLHQLYEQVRGYAAPIVLDRKTHDVGKLFMQAWDNLETSRAGRLVRLNVGFKRAVDRNCDVDALAIERVFANLIENALAATPDPVDLTVDWLNDQIHGRPALRIIVRDNGPGIPEETRSRIFEPFFTTKTSGTGLGLPLSRRNIESHNGWISIADSNGPGATFLIALPRKAT